MRPPSDALAIGHHIEIGLIDERAASFPSRVEDYDDHAMLTLAWPTDGDRRLIRFDTDQRLEVATYSRDATVCVRECVCSTAFASAKRR